MKHHKMKQNILRSFLAVLSTLSDLIKDEQFLGKIISSKTFFGILKMENLGTYGDWTTSLELTGLKSHLVGNDAGVSMMYFRHSNFIFKLQEHRFDRSLAFQARVNDSASFLDYELFDFILGETEHPSFS